MNNIDKINQLNKSIDKIIDEEFKLRPILQEDCHKRIWERFEILILSLKYEIMYLKELNK